MGHCYPNLRVEENGVTWVNLGHIIKNSKKNFYSNQFYYTHKISNISKKKIIFQGVIFKIKIKKKLILWSNPRQTIKILNFLYAQLTFDCS